MSKGGWKLVYGAWFYIDNFGHMLTGWQRINNYWYYLGEADDGAMKTGTVNIGGRNYTFNSSGILIN